MFPAKTFCPQMPRPWGLSSSGPEGMFEGGGVSTCKALLRQHPCPGCWPCPSVPSTNSWAPGLSTDDEMETAAALALPTIWQGVVAYNQMTAMKEGQCSEPEGFPGEGSLGSCLHGEVGIPD